MKIFLSLFLFLFLFADVEVKDVNFTDEEVNMTLLLLNHANYKELNDILQSNSKTEQILNYRYDKRDNGGITDLQDLADNTDLDSHNFNDLRLYSYKYSYDLVVKPIGTTYPLTNFLFALAGILVGFTIFFAIILHFIRG